MIDISLLNIVGVAVLTNMFTHWFAPIQGIKSRFVGLFSKYPKLQNPINTVLHCPKCFGFWSGIVLFSDVITGAVVSLLAFVIKFVIDRIDFWYE